MNISTRELKAFMLVADLRSFTRAAEQMHVTQAGLSNMVKSLERQFGSPLFVRTTRSVVPTDLGLRLLPIARRQVFELEELMEQSHRAAGAKARPVRLGATPILCSGLLPQLCRSFVRDDNDIAIEIVELHRAAIVDGIQAATLDLGLISDLGSLEGITAAAMFETGLIAVARGEASAAPPTELRWENLPQGTIVTLRPDDPMQMFMEQHIRKAGLSERDRIAVNQIDTQIGMAEAGMGVAITSSLALPACSRHAVSVYRLVDPEVTIRMMCITKTGRAARKAATVFLEYMATKLQDRGFNAMIAS